MGWSEKSGEGEKGGEEMKKFIGSLGSDLLEWIKRFGPALLAYFVVRAIQGETAGLIVAGVVLIEGEIVRPLREILALLRSEH
jgi:hypothetical protein